MNKTLVIITGGTIDAMYAPEKGTPYYVPVPASAAESCIPAALEKLGLREQCDIWPLAMKDSKDIKQADLDQMLQRIAQEGYQQVIVVHGTDTMPRSGRYLQCELAKRGLDQTKIILTGAMYPLRDGNKQWREEGPMSDGWKNLRMAFEVVKAVVPGAYIEMGEGPWDPRMVEKNVETEEMAVEGEPEKKITQVKHSGFVMRKEPVKDCEISFDH